MPQTKIVFFDIDGTLIDMQTKQITPKTVEALHRLQEEYFFYMWDESRNEARLVTSWDTTDEDIDRLAKSLAACFAPSKSI